MKTRKWMWLVAVVALPLSYGCAEAPATSTTVIEAPVAPPPPAEVAPAPAPGPALSAPAAEVVRLASAGTREDVVISYVQNSAAPFDLSADQILYLRDLGISPQVTTAMLNRDSALHSQPQVYTYNQTAYAPTVPPPAAVAPVAEPAPAPEPAVAPAPAAVPTAPPVVAPTPVYVSSPPPDVTYFYNDLSPYGTWIQLDGVGWCWQPRVVVVNRMWRPYCDSGHWVYTDAGWFWQSDYSWGWAPFHYGRWQLHNRCGWVWLPDRVWGPAWVTWRVAGDNCGWAPLPPHADFDVRLGFRFNGVSVAANFDFGLHPDHFTFIAMRDFHDHDFAHHRLPPTEVTKVYNHTTVINNYVVNNNTVVNQGIKVEQVSAATHTPVRKVAIRDVPAGRGGAPAAERSGNVVYRHELQTPARPVNMVAQKVDERHPVVQPAPVAPAPTPRVTASKPAPAPTARQTEAPKARPQTAPGRTPQADSQRAVTRPATAKPVTYNAPAAATKTAPPAPAAPALKVSSPVPAAPASAPVARNGNSGKQSNRPATTYQAGSAPTASATARPVAPPAPQAQRPVTANRPDQPGQLYPLRSAPAQNNAPPARPGNSERPSQAQAYYPPKSSRQAAETRMLPPNNPRPTAPAQSAPKGQSRKNED